jgi:predicted nucleic acid-binding protein
LAGYFFDSSALVKLYHPEAGTPVVDQIVNTSGNLVRVYRLTVAELTSGFAIKVRTQSISREDAVLLLRQFHREMATGSRRFSLSVNRSLPRPSCWLSVTRSRQLAQDTAY